MQLKIGVLAVQGLEASVPLLFCSYAVSRVLLVTMVVWLVTRSCIRIVLTMRRIEDLEEGFEYENFHTNLWIGVRYNRAPNDFCWAICSRNEVDTGTHSQGRRTWSPQSPGLGVCFLFICLFENIWIHLFHILTYNKGKVNK
jgi:hypothetical protein